VSDQEQPPQASTDSSTTFTPPTTPGEPPAAQGTGPAKDRNRLIAGIIAAVVIVGIVAGAYFVFFGGNKGPFAFSGEIASPGSCGGATTGFSAQMLAKDGSVIAQGPFAQHPAGSGCKITFGFELPKADSYQFALGLSDQVAAVAGTHSILGPTYTFEELKGMDFHLTLGPTDFTPPSPAPQPTAPSGAPGPSIHPTAPTSPAAPKSPTSSP
jgi:hypothetical protein